MYVVQTESCIFYLIPENIKSRIHEIIILLMFYSSEEKVTYHKDILIDDVWKQLAENTQT
jgi:hypothetical protein